MKKIFIEEKNIERLVFRDLYSKLKEEGYEDYSNKMIDSYIEINIRVIVKEEMKLSWDFASKKTEDAYNKLIEMGFVREFDTSEKKTKLVRQPLKYYGLTKKGWDLGIKMNKKESFYK